MYYYLHRVQRRDIRVTGLDLKADVIARCSALAAELGYEGLDFQIIRFLGVCSMSINSTIWVS